MAGIKQVATLDGISDYGENFGSPLFFDNSQVFAGDAVGISPQDGFEYNIIQGQPLTMDNLEEYGYYMIQSMLFFDVRSNFGHATNLLEFNGSHGAIGFAIDDMGQLHIEFYNANEPGKLATTPISSAANSGNQSRINQLENQLAAAKQQLTNAQTALINAQNAVNADRAQIAKDLPANLQTQLKADEAKLAHDQQMLISAQNQLESERQQLTTAQTNLVSAKTAVVNAQNSLQAATTKQLQAKADLNHANQVVQGAQNTLNTLNAQFNEC